LISELLETDGLETDVWPQELAPAVAAALDCPGTGSVVFGKDLRVIHCTSQLAAILGMERAPRPGCDLFATLQENRCVNGYSLAALEEELRRAVGDPEGVEVEADLAGIAAPRVFTVGARRIGADCWIATFQDITSTRSAESRLLKLALTDPLTGLSNRMCFEKQLAVALKAPGDSHSLETAAILLVDLDRFKAVNDTLGHPTGDALLKLVAGRLQFEVSPFGMAARLGGDEFAVLVSPGMRPAELAGLASRIIELLQRTFLVNGNVINVGASVGIAVAPSDGDSMDRLLKNADLALYQAKTSGRGRFFFFDQAMEERAQTRRTLELELRKALPLRQLEVCYRPQIDTASGELHGFKATLRWRHPKRGLLNAEDFTPMAEELGLTLQINDWLFRMACRQAARWESKYKLTIGSCWAQFDSGSFAESVIRALEAAALSSGRLEIEVNEGILLRNEQQVFSTLHNLRALGVRVAMGDFGTGYASLSQLASFPFDRVRINRSLLVDGGRNARHRAIVRAIAALGASLGISTMGEDIGSAAELARIHSGGCTTVQGYLPTGSLTAQEAEQFISAICESPCNLSIPSGERVHEQPHL
jgi:diguanylate cyclase (GGDEF)-like protein